jgi:hypothetical protein
MVRATIDYQGPAAVYIFARNVDCLGHRGK